MTVRNKLSSVFIKSAPAGKQGDGAGLWLIKREDGGGPVGVACNRAWSAARDGLRGN